MKLNRMKYLFLLLSTVAIFMSCNSDSDYFSLVAPTDQMQIKASTSSVSLEYALADNEAATFSWNAATNRGAGTELTYYFRFYQLGMKNNKSEMIEIEPGTYSITWTHKQLNDLLISWNILYGNTVTIVGEVIAEVTGTDVYMKPETSKVEITLKSYDPTNKMYFFYLDSNGEKKGIKMDETEEEGVFHLSGIFPECEYWFAKDNVTGYPTYGKGDSEGKLSYSPNDEILHFTNESEAFYVISLDINNLTIKFEEMPIYPSYYMVTENSGGTKQVIGLNSMANNINCFYWSGKLATGTKILGFTDDLNGTNIHYSPNAAATELLENGGSAFIVPETRVVVRRETWETKLDGYAISINLPTKKLTCLDVYNLPNGKVWMGGNMNSWKWTPLVQEDILNHPEIWSLNHNITANFNNFITLIEGQWDFGNIIIASGDPRSGWVDMFATPLGIQIGPDVALWRWPATVSGSRIELNMHTMQLRVY